MRHRYDSEVPKDVFVYFGSNMSRHTGTDKDLFARVAGALDEGIPVRVQVGRRIEDGEDFLRRMRGEGFAYLMPWGWK